MENRSARLERVFKTAWFSKAARKAKISDRELCEAIKQVMLGQADDLGGGVFKKRLSRNLYRSLVVASAGRFWVYEYLFAKKDRANIRDDELADFKALAKIYRSLTALQIEKILEHQDWIELCEGKKR
jgi:hypothetical protein